MNAFSSSSIIFGAKGSVSRLVPGVHSQPTCGSVTEGDPARVLAHDNALWAARDLGHKQALDQAYTFIAMGTDAEGLRAGQAAFTSGKRPEWRLR